MDVESYLNSKNLGYHKVSPKGEVSIRCPFHHDSRPSFSINIETGAWLCRSASCGLKGGFPLFYKLMEGINSWSEVYSKLKSSYSATNFDELFNFNSEKKKESDGVVYQNLPPTIFLKEFTNEFFPDWLEDRRYSKEILDPFNLKIAVGGQYRNCLIIPYYGWDGNLLTFAARRMRELRYSQESKYIYPENSPKSSILFGMNLLNNSNRLERIFIVEGPFDVFRLTSFGERALALSGSSLSDRQFLDICTICKLTGAKPVVMLDADAIEKTTKIYCELIAAGLSAKRVYLPEGVDPDKLLHNDFEQLENNLFSS